jgi:hypothetical protein
LNADLTVSEIAQAGWHGRVEIWRGNTEVLRFQIPLIKPGMPISGTRLSDKGIS